jgi:hypothetical protein
MTFSVQGWFAAKGHTKQMILNQAINQLDHCLPFSLQSRTKQPPMIKVVKVMNDAVRTGETFQKLSKVGFDTAVRSYAEWNKGIQEIATRVTENTKKAFEDTTRTWEQLISAKSVEQAIEIQTQYAKRAYDAYVAEASLLGDWYAGLVRNASKPVEQTVAKKAA